jgi:glycosyltransferase involved in cell wall biosynthesis
VAISGHQSRTHPTLPWAAIVHHGLDLARSPFERRAGDDLCFIGRVCPEKGILDAIEVARLTGRKLRIAAKVGPTPPEQDYFEQVFKPALAGADVEYLGELGGADRDRLMADSLATLVPGAWPEPFGLVVVESLACGTPVIGRRVGALPGIMREGVDGYFGDDPIHMAFLVERVAELDRVAIRTNAVDRFSISRMADGYEEVYASVLGGEEERPSERSAPRFLSEPRPSLASLTS